MKQRTAMLSVVSNTVLILIKVVAGTLTGSVAILTEAVHSAVDLIASLVALVSVRIADEPADAGHSYGHEKVENLAAAFEALLILVGSALIAFEAIRRLVIGGSTHTLGIGIGVIGFSAVANLVVSGVIARGGRRTGSPALEGDAAHLRTDAISSLAVLIALVLVQATGAQWIDPVAALVVASVIVVTGLRLLVRAGEVLVDQALPADEIEAIIAAIEGFGDDAIIGYHELRTRQGGSKRHVDVHVQFRRGTSLEQAHRIAHELQDQIAAVLGGADVLIHLEPEDRLRPGQQALHVG
ncbi:MAG TPA: cation diffusion facilitator family transporter [Solirubrobacteraceae bacterium]|jgi:cation diffusion facilitator family transporter|nr:cation diffusion facilitator family transporter [Solirubrobacteraceae bacterium]